MSLRQLFESDIVDDLKDTLNTGKGYVVDLAGRVKDTGVALGNKLAEINPKVEPTVQNTISQNSDLVSDFKSMSVPDFVKAYPNVSAGVGIPAAALMGMGALALSKRLKRR